MITTAGNLHIKRYLMGAVENIGASIALGVGTAAESAASTSLDFEVIRTNVTLVSYDFEANRLVFKAAVPEEFIGTVYEVGLWSRAADDLALDYGSRTIARFDSVEGWSGTFLASAGNGGRVGSDVLSHTPAASASTTSALTGITYDFSGNSAADQFLFAYNVGNANTTSLRFRFLTDGSNYYDFNLGAQTGGYKVTKVNKGTATVTGTPDWSAINEIQVTTVSGAGGASNVTFDGIRVEDTDTVNPDYVLVARDLLASPFVKNDTMTQDVEFSLAVNIT